MALLAVGGYFAYENWPAISAWFSTIVPMPTAGPATASGTYPNSPVPTSYSTMQTFVDSAGNQWQFSTQTNQWVIATPGPAVASSAGAAPITQPSVLPATPGTVVSTVPAVAHGEGGSAGTVVSTAPPVTPPAPQGPIVWRPISPILSRVAPQLVTAQPPAVDKTNVMWGSGPSVTIQTPAPVTDSSVVDNRVMTRSGGFMVNNR
jgi:hypothetical protein